jgi:hypothetical protein
LGECRGGERLRDKTLNQTHVKSSLTIGGTGEGGTYYYLRESEVNRRREVDEWEG